MHKAYVYERFSSPEQAAGDSSRRQKTAADLWCERRSDVEVDRELSFKDHGRSGFRGQQFTEGALGRFVEMVRAGSIQRGSFLLIENLDRFSRENPVTATGRLFDLANLGITVVTVSDGLEYSMDSLSGDIGRLLLLVVSLSQSHMESAKKSDRGSKAWGNKKARARLGEHKVSARCPEWLRLVDDEFAIDQERKRIVENIFDWTIAGMGRNVIARRLNAADVKPFKHDQKRKEGRPPPQGWHASAVAKILQNRAVLGEYQPGKGSHKSRNYEPDGDPILGYYPPIISDETFYRAKRAYEGRRQGSSGRRGNSGAHILRGLCRCGGCGGPMHVKNKGPLPKGGIYLVCSSADRLAGCTMIRRWRVDRLEPAVMRALSFVVPAALSSVDDGAPKAVARVEGLEGRLADANALRKRLLDAVKRTDDEDAMSEFEVQVAALSRRLDETDGDDRLDLRIRINEVLRGLVDRVLFEERAGAVMVLKARLDVRPQHGVAPYATRMVQDSEGHMVVSVLVEDDASDAQINAFLGIDPDAWSMEPAAE
jgi:DNA invertase Pin-like site-specific DNA recombinase